jgi:hypothetical protein
LAQEAEGRFQESPDDGLAKLLALRAAQVPLGSSKSANALLHSWMREPANALKVNPLQKTKRTIPWAATC